jgi:imidazolonepropionase-like amidohydrolase
MNSLFRLVLLLGLLVVRPGHAESLLLTNATIHPVTGPALTRASLLIRDGKIVAVGPTVTGSADQVVDLREQHVFPGLIAPTTILGLQEIDAIRATRDTTESGEYTPDVYSWKAVNPDSELIPVARANGYTHAQPIPLGPVVSGHSSVIALSGWTVEDMAIRRDAGLHMYWPSFGLDTTPKERSANPEQWKSLEDQIKARDRKLQQIDEFFGQAAAYDLARSAATPTSPVSLVPAWEAVLPVLRREIPVFLHADERRQIESAVNWAVRRKLRPVLAGGRDAWRVAPLLATNQIPVTYEHVFTQPVRDIDPYDVYFVAPSLLAQAGVQVSFTEGTDRFGASNVRNIPYAAAQARAFGLPYLEALRGLTLYPARILGIDDRLGTLEPGKDATFFVADGDILDLRTQVKRMWIAGREVSLESRHTRLYDRYRQRPKAP